MTRLIVALLILSASVGLAEKKRSLLQVQLGHEEQMNSLEAVHAERVATLESGYKRALEKLQASMQKAGDLDATLAVKKELTEFQPKVYSKQEMAALRPEVAKLRRKFDDTLVKISKDRRDRELALLKKHEQELKELQAELTRGGQLEAAVAVRDARDSVIARAKNLAAGKLPAAPATDPKKVEPAEPEAEPVAEPAAPEAEPEEEEIESPPLVATGGKLAPVATRVVCKGGIEGAADGVVTFHGPSGDGRSGAIGVLIKADPTSADTGSTWAMEYSRSRSARGLQIIHPRADGHAIIHITKSGISLSTPGDWCKVGYIGRGKDKIRGKKGFDQIFPLVDGHYYTIVSRMAGNGACEVFINGQLVMTANVRSNARPLSLEIPEGESFPRGGNPGKLAFSGEGLRLQWEKNWAGMIVEPLGSGNNIARNLRYCRGIAEVPATED